jgi:DNA-directed RNA polymerase specialized sigma24 family protein
MSSKTTSTETPAPGLRDLVKENDQKVYDFALYMCAGQEDVTDLVLDVFRRFGDFYKRSSSNSNSVIDQSELRLQLFAMAWNSIRRNLHGQSFSWPIGRDTRVQQEAEADLLLELAKEKVTEESRARFIARLAQVDSDLRAPLVLKDLLGFGDEEAVRILGTRWGVYRHRLHRGRLQLCEHLRGKPFVFVGTPVPVGR